MTNIRFLMFMLIVSLVTFASAALAQQGAIPDPYPMPDPSAIPEAILGLHPSVWPIIAIVYFAMQVADSYIPEESKAQWPAMVRQGWDWVLRNVGQSRNAGSVDNRPPTP